MSAQSGQFLRLVCFALVACGSPASARAQDDPVSRHEAIEMMYPIMISALEAKNFGRARNICDQAIIWEPQNPLHHYNLACIEAQTGGARLPYALGELDLAIALGFNDVDHLKTDPDLQPLHSDPKFAELVRKATYYATAGAALDSLVIPASPAKPPLASSAEPEVEKPAAAAFAQGVPVGLYLMTRYQASSRTVENAVWYFAPDGQVYQNLEKGFSRADLAAHTGRVGRAAFEEGKLTVTWKEGQKTAGALERDGTDFQWEMGIFAAVTPFEDVSELPGLYEGEESLPVEGNRSAAAKRLELRADGTYTWTGVSLDAATAASGRLATGDNQASNGRWQLHGYSLILKDKNGAVFRRMVFPSDDEKTVVKPDRMFFDGVLYKRQL